MRTKYRLLTASLRRTATRRLTSQDFELVATEEPRRLSSARKRWHLIYTLLRNPALLRLRASALEEEREKARLEQNPVVTVRRESNSRQGGGESGDSTISTSGNVGSNNGTTTTTTTASIETTAIGAAQAEVRGRSNSGRTHKRTRVEDEVTGLQATEEERMPIFGDRSRRRDATRLRETRDHSTHSSHSGTGGGNGGVTLRDNGTFTANSAFLQTSVNHDDNDNDEIPLVASDA